MAKQRKKKSSKAVSPAQLENQAYQLLDNQQFKSALPILKQLYKMEAKEAWLDGLVTCYSQRALQLMNKGMYKEAQFLWENLSKLPGQEFTSHPIRLSQYLFSLVKASSYAKAVKLYYDQEKMLCRPGMLTACRCRLWQAEIPLPVNGGLALDRISVA